MNKELVLVRDTTIPLRELEQLGVDTLPRNTNIWANTKAGNEAYERFKFMYKTKYRDSEINATTVDDFLDTVKLILMESENQIVSMARTTLDEFKYQDFISSKNISTTNASTVSQFELEAKSNQKNVNSSNQKNKADSKSDSSSDSSNEDTSKGWSNQSPTGNVKSQMQSLNDHATDLSNSDSRGKNKNNSKGTAISSAEAINAGTSRSDNINDQKSVSTSKNDQDYKTENIDYSKVFAFLEMQRKLNFDTEKFLLDRLRGAFLSIIKIETRHIQYY